MKILCVGKKGYDQLRRQFEKQIIELIELRSVKQMAFSNADVIGKKLIAMFEAGEFDVATGWGQEAIARALDLRFALDTLLASDIAPRLDARRIVAAGHSYGALIAQMLGGAGGAPDAAVAAVVTEVEVTVGEVQVAEGVEVQVNMQVKLLR